MARAIFISYRRDDSEGEAGRLFDDLVRVFGPGAVFMDVTDIHPGKDFRQAIDDNVAQCAVLLAIIGPAWVRLADSSGTRRIDQPNDFVRLEIASALKRGVDVIPVLVHGAAMPAPAELPADLQNLAFRNCVEVTHVRWNSDVETLTRALREYVPSPAPVGTRTIVRMIEGTEVAISAAETKPANVPSLQDPKQGQPKPDHPQPNQPQPNQPQPYQPGSAVRPTLRLPVLGIGLVAAAVFAAGSYILIHQELKKREEARLVPVAVPAQKVGTPGALNPALFQPLLGTWLNPQAQIGKPMRIQISVANGSLQLHIWNRCTPTLCDIGAKNVQLGGDGITTHWTAAFSNAGSEQVVSQTVALTIYRLGPGLHIIYGTLTGFTEFDMVRQ